MLDNIFLFWWIGDGKEYETTDRPVIENIFKIFVKLCLLVMVFYQI